MKIYFFMIFVFNSELAGIVSFESLDKENDIKIILKNKSKRVEEVIFLAPGATQKRFLDNGTILHFSYANKSLSEFQELILLKNHNKVLKVYGGFVIETYMFNFKSISRGLVFYSEKQIINGFEVILRDLNFTPKPLIIDNFKH